MKHFVFVFVFYPLVSGVLLCAAPLLGDDDASRPITYRRIYTPLNRLADWPRGDTLYKPMDAASFERWSRGNVTQKKIPQVTNAYFSAMLEDENQLSGEVVLEIVSPVKEMLAFPLEPCGVALSDLSWDRDGEKIPARLGSDADGRQFLFVPGSGTLRGRWSIRGSTDRVGQLEFQFLLPPSVSKTFEIDLPVGFAPDLTAAVVGPPAEISSNLRKWRLQLPGQSQIQMRILRDSVDTVVGQDLIKQSRAYEFRVDRVQLEQELFLSVYRKPRKQIVLSMDQGLRLVEASLGNQAIEWSEQDFPDARGRKFVLQLPEPVMGNDRIVRLRAMADPVFDNTWKIPRITPEGFSWKEGVTSILVASPLVMGQMVLVGCQQVRAGVVPGNSNAEIFEIQDHGPDAEVEVLLEARAFQGRVENATTYTFTDVSINGRMVADLRVLGSPQFSIQATVPDDWNIESVRARDEGVIERWRQEASGTRNRLMIDLRRGVSVSRPLRLEITGRKNVPQANSRIALETLQMLQFEGFETDRELVELKALDPYRVKVSRAADFKGVSFTELTAEEQDRVQDNFSTKQVGASRSKSGVSGSGENIEIPPTAKSPSRFWYDRSRMALMEIRVEKPTPRFTTQTRIEAQVSDGKISEQCIVDCSPQDSGIDALEIAFSKSATSTIQCAVVDQAGVALDGVRVSRISRQEVGDGQAAERWIVRWNRPLSDPFQLIINRSVDFEDQIEVALVGVPKASEQRATIAILSGLGNHLVVKNRGLKALPVEEGSHFVRNPMRARFRYNPQRDVREGSVNGLFLERQGVAVGSALIWRAVVESWFAPSGEGVHRATYYIENENRSFFSASLETGDRFQAAEIDGVQVRMPPADVNLPLTIALSENQRFSVVELQWTTPFTGGWLPWIKQVRLPLPDVDLPILSNERIIHAPPGFVAADSLSGNDAARSGLSWQQRLFGPLARTTATAVFDPFDSDTWSDIPFMAVDDARRQRRIAEQILEQMGGVLLSQPLSAAWGDFAQIGKLSPEDSAKDGLTLRVDRDALATAGIGPETPIQVHPERSLRRLALESLRKANLVIGLDPKGGVLSTAESLRPVDSAWVIDGVVCQIKDKAIADADSTTRDPSVFTFSEWRQEDVPTEFPWTPVWREGFDAVKNQGGSTVYLDGSEANLAQVQLVNVEALRGLQWTLFAVVALAGCLWGPSSIRKGMLCVMFLAIAALVLPAILAPLATSGFCAAAFAFIWKRFNSSPSVARFKIGSRERFREVDPDPITKTMRVTGSELLLLLLGGTLTLAGIPAISSQAAPLAENLPVVVVPIDEKNQPVGDTYYLSSSLFDAVHRDRSHEQGPMNWLLLDARYQIDFAWTPDHSQITADLCIAKMQIEVLGHQAMIHLPLGQMLTAETKPLIKVDGKETDTVPHMTGTGISLQLEEPGIYLIEIPVPLKIEKVGGMRQVNCPIPSLVTSQVEIKYPADAAPPDVMSAKGVVEADRVRSRLQAQLGDASRLIVRWQEDESVGESGLADVDQLLWLNVQPGAVVVDARFKFDVEDRRIQRVQLVADPQLRLLSPTRAFANGEPIELKHLRTLSQDPQKIDLQWDSGVSGAMELRVSFLWTGVSGVGNIRIPELEVQGARYTRRWVAITVDPALVVERESISQDDKLKPLSEATVGEIWDLSQQSDGFFYEQTGLDIDWSLPTRLQKSETIGFAKVAIGVSDARSEVFAEYELETTDGNRCQYEIEIPSAFVPEKVEMRSDDVDQLMRWSVRKQAGVDRLTLFLAEPVRGGLKIILRGHLKHSPERLSVPHFSLRDVRMRGGQVALYRKSTVQLALEDVDHAWQIFDDFVPMSEPLPDFGRLMGIFRIATDDLPQVVNIRPNEVDAEAVQVVSLDRKDGRWEIDVDLRLLVRSGQLDSLRFRIPKEFQGPFQIDPNVPFQVKELPGDEGFVLDITLPTAVDGSYRVLLRGFLDVAPEDPVRCPIISVEELDPISQFVVLPKQVDFQDVSWKTTGLIAESLPEDPENAPLSDTSVASFRVVEPMTHRAVLQSVDQLAEEPQVSLAQIDVCSGEAAQYVGRAIFDLDPAGLSTVVITLPHDDASLLRVHVNDRHAIAQETEQGWEIALHSRNLLQRVEVLYSSPYDMVGKTMSGSRPTLRSAKQPIPIAQTNWAFSCAGSHFSILPQSGKTDSPAQSALSVQYFYLLQRARNLLDALSDVTSAEPVDVLLPWYARTMGQLLALERSMGRLLRQMPAEMSGELTTRQTVLADQVRNVASQLMNQGVFASKVALEQIGVSKPVPWQALFARNKEIVRCVSDQPPVLINKARRVRSSEAFRWSLAGLLGSVLVCISIWPQITDRVLCRCYPLIPIAFALSFFYWLFLSPSAVGFFAMLFAVLLAMVVPWNWAVGEMAQTYGAHGVQKR
tara:strand:- start:45306 stop:52541 length:7236 start_codon:yes stop_codon:yes gene_type:complete